MPNHVHLILVPKDETGLARAIGAAHRRDTHFVNARGRWTGHLFQSRFASVTMGEGHLANAVRYVSLNPVRARLVKHAQDWPWSSVRAHLKAEDDGLVTVRPVLSRLPDFARLLLSREESGFDALRASEATGRSLGNTAFIEGLERLLGRRLSKRAPGRKPRVADDSRGMLL
jgi:putative transposase